MRTKYDEDEKLLIQASEAIDSNEKMNSLVMFVLPDVRTIRNFTSKYIEHFDSYMSSPYTDAVVGITHGIERYSLLRWLINYSAVSVAAYLRGDVTDNARATRIAARRMADAVELQALHATWVTMALDGDPCASTLKDGVLALALRISRRAVKRGK